MRRFRKFPKTFIPKTSKMKHKKLKILIIVWIFLILINYYYMPYFILPLVWLLNVLVLLVIVLIQMIKIFKERKNISRQRIVIFISVSLITFFSFYKFYGIPNLFIEKLDWIILKEKRKDIVSDVKKGILKSNVSWNNVVCELPFEFPVVSNGGNDICISKNKTNQKYTVKFWVFRNFFDSPSTYLIYTEDDQNIKYYNEKIKNDPERNWKIDNNWYRIFGD